MNDQDKRPVSTSKGAFRVVLLYGLFGGIWILVSDRVLGFFVQDPYRLTLFQTLKGWLFVAAGMLLLFCFVKHELRMREKAEADITESEEKYRTLFENAGDAIIMIDAETGIILEANRKAGDLIGRSPGEIVGLYQSQLHPPDERGDFTRLLFEAVRNGRSFSDDLTLPRKNGEKIPVEISATLIDVGVKKLILAIFRDISARKATEKALEAEKDKAEQYLNVAEVILLVIGSDQRVKLINQKGCEILGFAEEDVLEKNWFENFLPERLRDHVRTKFQGMIAGAENDFDYFENPVLTRDGEERIIAWHNAILRDENGEIVSTLSSGEDITERKRAEAKAQDRLEQLSALHAIDRIITSSLDFNLTLDLITDQVVSRLNVDAAEILLLNTDTQLLQYAAGRGFRSDALSRATLRIGEGVAGKAALERRTVTLPDLLAAGDRFIRAPLIAEEGFRSYFGLPLVARGVVKGVLEIFHRSPLTPSDEWLKFLEALAAQAAIAIDNASLFNQLQQSNTELKRAYDATLEGWGRALELYDPQTQGHTKRVTDMTLRLAQEMGMPDDQLIHVRRGSLLHDIGKIGIPDRILRNPGPLTRDEWRTMRRHPEYAFKLLQPIEYLRPAIDIPYSHHEKWDGSGYPRGLKGDEIPLAARIFAVADVWDALSSERPYREKLPSEKVRETIAALSGTHFDPKVVSVFLKMEW